MGPPTRPRKRKAPTLRASDWEPYKARIVELHIMEKRPLQEVREAIKMEFGFTAEIRQYRTRISQWGLDKNIKPEEMRSIVRKRQQRKLVEVNKGELIFQVRGYKIEPQKIDRWMKRHEVPESTLYAPSPAASTPSAVGCRTVSERGSPVLSPAYSVATPIISPGGIFHMGQSPQISSPALSISSIVRPQGNIFAGQSPAPTYRSLPNFLLSAPVIPGVFQGQSASAQPYPPGFALPLEIGHMTTGSMWYRYKQTDEEHLREKLSSAELLHGTNHSETLGILSKLGNVLIDQGRYKSAEEVIRRLVEGRRDVNGNDDVNTFHALELLGRVLAHQGHYTEAKKLHQRTLEFRKAMLGEEHPATLTSVSNLGLVLESQGKYKEAEAMHRRALEGREKVLWPEHLHTLTSVSHLGLVLSRQGKHKEAEAMHRRDLEGSEKVLGPEHPDTLNSVSNLGSVLESQGKYKEAEAMHRRDLEGSEKVLGPEHPDTLTSVSHLGSVLSRQGKYEEAEAMHRRALEGREKVLGPEHPDTLTSVNMKRQKRCTDEH
ncbi:TPR-like protein [Cenococcum geophilum 1.58]|uniref:TPR-like protein n=1 Tax=Cenococcum geophilum 1.58 TaxID=794803 RepID=A0ACC8ELE0_9PEZI|nr:TPR-like protein [Cenococcum geophilum 1.58]